MQARKSAKEILTKSTFEVDYPTALELRSAHWRAFAYEIDTLGKELAQNVSVKDFKHFLKMERLGRLATALGFLTAWIIPNPVSALLISLGNYARWALVLHQISHGAFDRIDEVPVKYKSNYFAKGIRRFLDWFDWIIPESWDHEHNALHHYHLGSHKDPDVVIRNTEYIRTRASRLVRYFLTGVMICVWKPAYYAVNTLTESRFQRGLLGSNKIGWNSWSLRTPEGRELWFKSLLPYALFKFVIVPSLFLPLGHFAAMSVFINVVVAEVLANVHSFLMIAPNHTGDDRYMFSETAKGKADYYLRQILGTVNYPSTNDFMDFLYGGMNYQVEHHLWPDLSIRQYKVARPRLIEICQRYGIQYLEEPVHKRIVKTFKIVAGELGQPEVKGK